MGSSLNETIVKACNFGILNPSNVNWCMGDVNWSLIYFVNIFFSRFHVIGSVCHMDVKVHVRILP